MARTDSLLITTRIESKIFVVRGHRIILDQNLAVLYGVTTAALNQAVARNADRFPEDFAFRLTVSEAAALKSQIVISKGGRGGRRRSTPRAFTEQGVAMLSSVLKSKRAVLVNVAIMRTFVRLREILGRHRQLLRRLEQLEQKMGTHDQSIREIFEALQQLVTEPPRPPRRIGY